MLRADLSLPVTFDFASRQIVFSREIERHTANNFTIGWCSKRNFLSTASSFYNKRSACSFQCDVSVQEFYL